MKLFQAKKKFSYKDLFLSVLLFLVLICAFFVGFDNTSKRNATEQLSVTQQSVKKAIINCYAIEGSYPPDIPYLEKHYGLTIDHTKFVVNYQVTGSNVLPYVEVVQKGHDDSAGGV